MMRRSLLSLLAASIGVICYAANATAQVQAGTAVRPETTTVGQHFVATVVVKVPAGIRVTFPARPDSAAHVDSAGPSVRRDSSVGGFTYATANYTLAAWDTGFQRIGLDTLTVVTSAGARLVPLNGFQVYVRSVLPRDTALRKPKPFRPVVPVPVFNWLPWLIGALIAAIVGVLIYAWRRWRRWRERRARGLTPFQTAEKEFRRIESENLIAAGAPERHAVLMAAVMRVYLASVVPPAMRSATTHELAIRLRPANAVPLQRVIAVLDETDRIKFARERSTADRARDIGAEARAIVAAVNSALEAEAAALEKAA